MSRLAAVAGGSCGSKSAVRKSLHSSDSAFALMPDHEAHDYAERIREQLPRKLQDAHEAAKLIKYAL